MQPEILLFSSHSEKIVKKVDSTYYIRSSFSDKISLYKNRYINDAFFFHLYVASFVLAGIISLI